MLCICILLFASAFQGVQAPPAGASARALVEAAREQAWREEHHDEARALLDLALERTSWTTSTPAESAQLLRELADLAHHLGAVDAAREARARAYTTMASLRDPDHAELRELGRNIAWCCAQMGDLAQAEGWGRRALASCERATDATALELALTRRDLVLTLLEQGKGEAGRALLTTAIGELEADPEAQPELSALRIELGLAWNLVGERDRACDLFQDALENSEPWLLSATAPQLDEDEVAWQWAWIELALKVAHVLGWEEGMDLIERLGPLQSVEADAAREHLSDLRATLLTKLRQAPRGEPGGLDLFQVLADGYAHRLRGHTEGWYALAQGGRPALTLVRAAEIGRERLVAQLLERGVDPNVCIKEVFGWQSGEPATMIRAALPLAVSNGRIGVVRMLLARGADPDLRWTNGVTSLGLSTSATSGAEIARVLLDAGANPLVYYRERNDLALSDAARWSDLETFSLLLEATRVAGLNAADEQRIVAELRASDRDLRHVKLAALTFERASAIERAARLGPAAELRKLLEAGGAPRTEEARWQPIHWAAGPQGDDERLQILLEAGADPNGASEGGHTPLHAAAMAGSAARVELLLAAGADVGAADAEGRTPLHVAARHSGAQVVQLLLAAGADVTRAGWGKQTALDIARRRGEAEVLELLQAAWEARSWPTSAEEIELVDSSKDGASPGQFWIGEIEVRQDEGGRFVAEGNVWVSNPTVPLAFTIHWTFASEEVEVGRLVADVGAVRAFSYSAALPGAAPWEVSLVLRPDRQLALDQLDTWSIWGQEVRFAARVLRLR